MKRRRVVKYDFTTAISGASLFARRKRKKIDNWKPTFDRMPLSKLSYRFTTTIWKVKVQTTFDGTHKGRMSNHSKLISLHIVTNYIIYLLDREKKKSTAGKMPEQEKSKANYINGNSIDECFWVSSENNNKSHNANLLHGSTCGIYALAQANTECCALTVKMKGKQQKSQLISQ